VDDYLLCVVVISFFDLFREPFSRCNIECFLCLGDFLLPEFHALVLSYVFK